jgi:hypothetical protein
VCGKDTHLVYIPDKDGAHTGLPSLLPFPCAPAGLAKDSCLPLVEWILYVQLLAYSGYYLFIYLFAVVGFELRAFTLSHIASPFL